MLRLYGQRDCSQLIHCPESKKVLKKLEVLNNISVRTVQHDIFALVFLESLIETADCTFLRLVEAGVRTSHVTLEHFADAEGVSFSAPISALHINRKCFGRTKRGAFQNETMSESWQ